MFLNNAENEDIASGKSSIASNFFENIIIQHAVGNYPAIFIDGGIFNKINAQIIDWTGYHCESTRKSKSNVISFLPADASKIKKE